MAVDDGGEKGKWMNRGDTWKVGGGGRDAKVLMNQMKAKTT